MKLMIKGLLAATLLSGVAASPANAAPVFNNGAPDHNNGYNYSLTYTSADDFRFTTATSVTGATFYALGSSPVTSLTYFIYAAGASGPGTQLATGTAQGLTYSPTGGTYFGLQEALLTFNFASAFNAAANTTYWLGLNTGSTTSYWETTGANATSVAYQSNNGAFSATTDQLAFTLNGTSATGAVPEPATWAMMVLGFGAVGVSLRRRSQQVRVRFA